MGLLHGNFFYGSRYWFIGAKGTGSVVQKSADAFGRLVTVTAAASTEVYRGLHRSTKVYRGL